MDNLAPVTIYCTHGKHGGRGLVTNVVSSEEPVPFVDAYNDGLVHRQGEDKCPWHGYDHLRAEFGEERVQEEENGLREYFK